jgi:predicted ArsR family transcriptional regulator
MTTMATEQLTLWQQTVLGVVKEHREPVTASEMSGHLLVNYGKAYRALVALEEKGLVGANYTSGKRGRAYEMTRRGSEAARSLFGDEDLR